MAQTVEATTKQADAAQPPPLKISRVLHAHRDRAFAAWCSAEHLKRWFAPHDYTTPHAEIEARVGGLFELTMRAPDGHEHLLHGVFREVVPDTRLVIDMRVTQGDGAPLFRAVTELDFADALGGVQLDVTQTYTFDNPALAVAMVGGAEAGWGATLSQLETELLRDQGGVGVIERSVVHATFHLERTYDAPAARLWKALTDPAAKDKWFGPQTGFERHERHMDVRVGGSERLKGRWENSVVSSFDALYLDVVPQERLVYSYVMHMNEKKISVSLATMQLKATGSKTTLLVTEQGAFLDGYDDAGSRETGTGYLLDALGASLKD
jgi:uncharacterized protein YndB with AHSA1/START domain